MKILKIITIGLLLPNLILYIIGAFIALDWNISHWSIFSHILGRIIVVIIELVAISTIPETAETLDL